MVLGDSMEFSYISRHYSQLIPPALIGPNLIYLVPSSKKKFEKGTIGKGSKKDFSDSFLKFQIAFKKSM